MWCAIWNWQATQAASMQRTGTERAWIRRNSRRNSRAQAEAVLDNPVEEMENTIGDVTMDVYVRKDGKMAGFSYETDATVEEENVRFTAMFPLAAVTTCCRM